MKKFLSVTVFSLLTVGFFTWFSNFGIPQIVPAPPPVVEDLDLGAMTMDQFIALGEKIFKGRGTCTLCHNAVGGRAPLLDKAAEDAKERLSDPRYKGAAKDVEGYLYESMIEPSAYVVAGFGKKGTNDTVSPMPAVTSGSIGLSEAEIKAVIAYLQRLSGSEVTVEIPSEAKEDETETAGGREPLDTVEDVLAEFACGACHKVGSEEGEAGPDLRNIGARRDAAYLRRSIIDPNAEIAEGFERDLMPPDYGEQMYAKELELVVAYLANSK